MFDIQIVDTTSAHIRELANNLRENDRREIEVYGFNTGKALWRSFKGTLMRQTALVDGMVGACWGVGGIPMGGIGQPFLMTSYASEKISPLKFARIYQEQVFRMLELFPKLVNYVNVEYDNAIRLLDIIGFKIGEPEPLGVNNALFRKFTLER